MSIQTENPIVNSCDPPAITTLNESAMSESRFRSGVRHGHFWTGRSITEEKAFRFQSLDSLRGLCACFVALGHFMSFPVTDSAFFRNSHLFVDFFFILSGFVISWNYEERLTSWREVRRFAILRIGRLYPLHVTVLLVLVGFELVRYGRYPYLLSFPPFGEFASPASIPTNLLLIQSMNIHDTTTWNRPSWSISTEIWAYAAFAVVAMTIGARTKLLLAVIPALLSIVIFRTHYGMDVTYDYGFARCVLGFSLGVVCCHVYKRDSGKQRDMLAYTAMEIAVVAAVGLLIFVLDYAWWPFTAPFVMWCAVLLFAREAGVISVLLRSRPLRLLGMLSYSIYMTHWIVSYPFYIGINHLNNHFDVNLWGIVQRSEGPIQVYGRTLVEGWLFSALFIATTVATSFLTFRFIERPGRAWSRRYCSAIGEGERKTLLQPERSST